jgi:hypothetical protein
VKHPVTPDGRYFVVRGRLWRMANPDLVGRLMAAWRAVTRLVGRWHFLIYRTKNAGLKVRNLFKR